MFKDASQSLTLSNIASTKNPVVSQFKIYGSRYLTSSYTHPKIRTTLPEAKANIIIPVSALQSQSGANTRTRNKTIRGEVIDQISAARFQASD